MCMNSNRVIAYCNRLRCMLNRAFKTDVFLSSCSPDTSRSHSIFFFRHYSPLGPTCLTNSHIHTVYIPLNLVHFPTSAHVTKHNAYFIYSPESFSVSPQFIPASFIITFPGVEQNQLADLGLVVFSQPQERGNSKLILEILPRKLKDLSV